MADNDKLAEFDYTVRADGKRTAATETFWFDDDGDPGTLEAHINQIDWTYDDAGRLIGRVAGARVDRIRSWHTENRAR